METTLMLRRLQEELADELQRMGQLRGVFQAQHFADEVDAASHLEAAHLAQCSARRSAQRSTGSSRALRISISTSMR